MVGKSLQQLDVRRSHDVNVVGIKIGEEVEVNPRSGKDSAGRYALIIIGSNYALEKYRRCEV